jgi:hypothetical protein
MSQDCGWCALVNVTGAASITPESAISIANKLEDELCSSESKLECKSQSRHFDRCSGNYSGRALKAIAAKHNYGFYRLAREQAGKCGHARALFEGLCSLDSARVCGAIWRLGDADGFAASQGHWVCASHLHSCF